MKSAYKTTERIVQAAMGGTMDSLKNVRSENGGRIDLTTLWRISYGRNKEGEQAVCITHLPPFDTAIVIDGLLISFEGVTVLVDRDVWNDHSSQEWSEI